MFDINTLNIFIIYMCILKEKVIFVRKKVRVFLSKMGIFWMKKNGLQFDISFALFNRLSSNFIIENTNSKNIWFYFYF